MTNELNFEHCISVLCCLYKKFCSNPLSISHAADEGCVSKEVSCDICIFMIALLPLTGVLLSILQEKPTYQAFKIVFNLNT